MLRIVGCALLEDGMPLTPMPRESLPAYPPLFAGVNPCVEGGIFFPVKPLSYFCPVACGCRSGDPHCPDSCPARDPTAPPTCPADWLGMMFTGGPALDATPNCPIDTNVRIAQV